MTDSKDDDANFWIDKLKKDFEQIGDMPAMWQWSARELVCAANVLYQRFIATTLADEEGLRPVQEGGKVIPDRFYTSLTPVMLLYGYAIENLIKGLLIAKGIPVTSGGKLNKQLQKHSLKDLFQLAAVSISPEDESLLERLKVTIESGKYPIPTKPRSQIGKSFYIVPSDIKRIGNLLRRLEEELCIVQPDKTSVPIDLMALCKNT